MQIEILILTTLAVLILTVVGILLMELPDYIKERRARKR